jgi:anaerobic ribonucleoside-triphosphate reductase activating protein
VWFQGCSIRCEGCVSADTWGRGQGGSTVANVLDVITQWLPQSDGVTVSGGEPFDQLDALLLLLKKIRARTSVDILVYSGYSLEYLRPHLGAIDGLVDALITDPYDVLAPQTMALRGSDNQRLHRLTALGELRFADFERETRLDEVVLDVMFGDEGTVWMAGIPRRGDLYRLGKLLEARGASVVTSQATVVSRSRRSDE